MEDGLRLCELETLLALRQRPPVAPIATRRVRTVGDLTALRSRPQDSCSLDSVPAHRQLAALTMRAASVASVLKRGAKRAATTVAAATVAAAKGAAATAAKGAAGGAVASSVELGAEKAPATTQCRRRLMKELRRWSKAPHTAFDIFPCEDDITEWRVIMAGAEQTPYEGGCWLLVVSFPADFPRQPPELRCVTPIRPAHCFCGLSLRVSTSAVS